MNADGRYVAEIPAAMRREGVRWLVLRQEETSGGWLLLGHQTLEEGSEFDSWHQTRDQALEEANRLWGVAPSAWRTDLRAV
jgi:hypothetical protein